MKIQEIMSTEVETVSPETSLKRVAEILSSRGISGVPVVDDQKIVLGVVSEADILFKERGPSTRAGILSWLLDSYRWQGHLKLEARTAREAMTSPAIVIDPQRPVADAAHVMLAKRVNRLPVVAGGKLVGIVTRADIVRAFARSDESIAAEIREYVEGRASWVRFPETIEVAVADGVVRLDGTVDRTADAELVGAFAAGVPGVVDVESTLTPTDEHVSGKSR